MPRKRPSHDSVTTWLGLAIVLSLTALPTQTASAQSFKLLYTFGGGAAGANPSAGVSMDQGGNLYGTTTWGGTGSVGTVYRLSKRGSGWVMASLYSFGAGQDGAQPWSGVVIGPDGALYGTTRIGGGNGCGSGLGCGTVFRLTPPAAFCKAVSCPWKETVLHRFTGTPDGNGPYSNVTFDASGSIYLTTLYGGQYDAGAVVKLVPAHGWTENVLYGFQIADNTGYWPRAGVVLDQTGNLYGTTTWGGTHDPYQGTVYKLVPSNGGWAQDTLYTFGCQPDGSVPTATLTFDRSGNLYGSTNACSHCGGAVFLMTPSNGGWSFSVLKSFVGDASPLGSVTMDAAGNLYSTTCVGGTSGNGNVFRLTPSEGGWTYTSLHDFTGQDGSCPTGGVIVDASGNLYGTTSAGGANNGQGVVFEITP